MEKKSDAYNLDWCQLVTFLKKRENLQTIFCQVTLKINPLSSFSTMRTYKAYSLSEKLKLKNTKKATMVSSNTISTTTTTLMKII